MEIVMQNDVNYWFTADTHFDDDEIIGLENRPFANIEDMREKLIANWNSVVRPKDIVWHLGDFGKMLDNKASNLAAICERLNGSLNIILGNHDRNNMWKIKKKFGFCSDYNEICIDYIGDGRPRKQYINLFHYPIASWRDWSKGSWHLFGHCHGNWTNRCKSFDIGTMNHGWRPLSFAEVAAKMDTLPFREGVKDMKDYK